MCNGFYWRIGTEPGRRSWIVNAFGAHARLLRFPHMYVFYESIKLRFNLFLFRLQRSVLWLRLCFYSWNVWNLYHSRVGKFSAVKQSLACWNSLAPRLCYDKWTCSWYFFYNGVTGFDCRIIRLCRLPWWDFNLRLNWAAKERILLGLHLSFLL